jgi:asparagine synthase (glutamine-hydrolysing)
MDNKMPKPLLVRAVQSNLPSNVVYRKKRGFTLPFEAWLRDQLRATIVRSLRGSSPLASVLNPAAISRIWDDFLEGRTSWSRPWSLFVLDSWCELNSVNA